MRDTTSTTTDTTDRRILIRVAALVAAVGAFLLLAAGSAQAASRSHVSYAPHLDRKIVHTRAVAHGTQLATWYGPGLYGNRTACGSTLKPRTWGIAHRTLPCGTLVTLNHHGRKVSVRVIDRGPFSGATVDLTERTKRFLHFTSGTVRMTEVKRYRVLPRLVARS